MNRKGLELGVGVFLLIGLACLAYLSFNLGDVNLFKNPYYKVHAKFSTVGGLNQDALISMAGVRIGQVQSIRLQDGQALVTLGILKDVQLEEDVIASIKTSGIIGEKYISISPGASDVYIEPEGYIRDTQPPLDIENLIAQYVFGNVKQSPGLGD